MLDENEDWVMEQEGELAEFIIGSQLEDVHISRQKIVTKMTHARISKRLDYIFMS